MRQTASALYEGFTLRYYRSDRAVGGIIAKHGRYEPFETAALLSFLHPGDVMVDAGANIGAYTLPASRAVGPAGKVYAFEPEPANRQLLEGNLTENGISNVTVSPMALSAKKQSLSLHLSRTNPGDHRLFPEKNKPRREIAIGADSLDRQLHSVFAETRPVRLIKSDTQGHEPFVIEGAREIIRRDKPAIFLEYWPWGFRRSGAEENRMIGFLQETYGTMYFIDEENKELRETGKTEIDAYCRSHRGYQHCNLLFRPS